MSATGAKEPLAKQLVCTTCWNEHYPAYVNQISAGEIGCEFCMRPAATMTETEYAEAIRLNKQFMGIVETPKRTREADPGE